MRRLVPVLLALLTGCTASVEKPPPGPPTAGAKPPARAPPPGPSQAICDATGCPLFCPRAACGATNEACLARCKSVCGDGYFDDRDGPVMACVLGAEGDGCAALRRCCEVSFTSQLCAPGLQQDVPTADATGAGSD